MYLCTCAQWLSLYLPLCTVFLKDSACYVLDLVLGEWSKSGADKVREVTYTLSLNYSIGPKTSPSTEKQVCDSEGFNCWLFSLKLVHVLGHCNCYLILCLTDFFL